jgi:prolipoprotein diacylglyceryltransferase
MGMVLSIPLLLFGAVLIAIALRRPPRDAVQAVQ